MLATASRQRTAALGYDGPSARDGRIDILRGIAIVFLTAEMVVQLTRPTAVLFESTGTLSAIAFLVATEGAVMGMLYRPRFAGGAVGESVLRIWKSGRAHYLAVVAATAALLALTLVPWVSTAPLTALSSHAARGSLFAPPPVDAADVTIGYPLDPNIVLDILLLRLGPWPLDVIGVLVGLFVVAPAALWALGRGKWFLVLFVSAALYVIELVTQLRILPTRAEASLPALGWQFIFVLGLLGGYYRRELVARFRGRVGRWVFAVLAAIAASIIALPWFTGNVTTSYPDLLARFAGTDTGWLFEPSAPGPLRAVVAVVFIIVTYGLLTVAWRPLHAVFGWLLSALGRSTIASTMLLVAAGVVVVSVPGIRDSPLPAVVIIAATVLAMRGALALLAQRRSAR
ncbi:hypothetical protein GCM10027413_01520 [Conyzicola nivalis]|uniref:Uncharacterized protein n=1 Tax=Conyzicola nivalis TaxID=1477021 RepID=A0A916WLK2_9MICO|nr:OpgC domain-containing protein [Conyzicola nivalis]GGB09494.1 hypothetical protein GCM10010979_25120 [Conyzicola nivalis]